MKKHLIIILVSLGIKSFSQGDCIDTVIKSINNFPWKQPAKRVPADSVLRIGSIYNPGDVVYTFDKPGLTKAGEDSLKKWSRIIQLNPDLVFEIAVHTEKRGAAEYNRKLSELRALLVYDYLIRSYHVREENISCKGYGSSQNLYEEGGSLSVSDINRRNRRTELRVIKRKDFLDSASFKKNYKQYYTLEAKDIRKVEGQLSVVLKIPELQFEPRIRPESKDSLKLIADFVKQHPGYFFEIACHTDSRGKSISNYTLSIARARTVWEFLTKEEGVNPCQLTYAGYGSKCLLVPDEEIKKAATKQQKEELHQKNRRTELRVLGKRN